MGKWTYAKHCRRQKGMNTTRKRRQRQAQLGRKIKVQKPKILAQFRTSVKHQIKDFFVSIRKRLFNR